MTTPQDLLAEVKRLDKLRTPGEWKGRSSDRHKIFAVTPANDFRHEICAYVKIQNRDFIALAPSMARLIRDFEARKEMLVEALVLAKEHVEHDVLCCIGNRPPKPCSCGVSGAIMNIEETLARAASGEWMEEV
jgi:hypothetical protein